MDSEKYVQRNKTVVSAVCLVIDTARLYVALHKIERYTAQERFYQ